MSWRARILFVSVAGLLAQGPCRIDAISCPAAQHCGSTQARSLSAPPASSQPGDCCSMQAPATVTGRETLAPQHWRSPAATPISLCSALALKDARHHAADPSRAPHPPRLYTLHSALLL